MDEVAAPRKKKHKLPPSSNPDVQEISGSEDDINYAADRDEEAESQPPHPTPGQTSAKVLKPSAKGTANAAPLAPLTKPPVKPKAQAELPATKSSAAGVARPEDILLGPGFICPSYISDEFGVNAAFVNVFWDPHGWDKSCGRGRAYSSSLERPTNIEATLKLIRIQRATVVRIGLDLVSYDARFSVRGLHSLNSKEADAQLSVLWDHEYDIDSIRQIYMGLLPVSSKSRTGTSDPWRMNKSTMVEALVHARVPFVYFNWMQELAVELQRNTYKQNTSCEEARRRYLLHWVFCSGDDFKKREEEVLGVLNAVDPKTVKVPIPAELPSDQVADLSPTEDSAEPGSPVKNKKLVVVKRKGRDRHVSEGPPEPGDHPAKSPSSGSCRSPRSQSRHSESSRNRSPKRSKSERSRHRSRSSKDSRRSRSSKHSRRSRSRSPTRGGKRSRRSPSSSSSSSSRSSSSSSSRSSSIQSSLTKALKGFVKAAKEKPKKARSRIDKHLDRLDEGLRSGSYIDPCAYSSAHLISIETKGSPAKDCLTFQNGRLVTDESAAEDVTGAPSSMAALKEGLHFIAQRLMTVKEFKSDTRRVADRYEFIRYLESDFAAAQSTEKIPIIKEFLRRVRAERLWCPEIPKQSALFFRAFAVPPTKNVHVDEDGEQIRKRRRDKVRQDKPTRGNRGGGGGGNVGRGRGGRGGGGGGPPGPGMMPNLFSDDERKKNGTCLSRMTKVGVCPSVGKPWECKMDHSCPRCPGRSHIAKNCKLLA